jgi:hypothetical protein
MSCCFEAALAGGGVLRLALAQTAADALDAALALAEHEGLIAAMEAALQMPLDPHPVAQFEGEADDMLWLDADAGTRLGLPWPALLSMANAPAWPIAWPTLAFDVEVAAFETRPLPEDAATGVLLLPPAFEPAWRVALHDGTLGLVAEGEWRGPGSEIVFDAAPEPERIPARRAPWRVLLDQRCERPLPELLGWVTPAAPLRPGDAAWLVGPHGQRQPGRIAPALAGAGLWI